MTMDWMGFAVDGKLLIGKRSPIKDEIPGIFQQPGARERWIADVPSLDLDRTP